MINDNFMINKLTTIVNFKTRITRFKIQLVVAVKSLICNNNHFRNYTM